MSTMTYYVAVPFIRTDDGDLVAGEGVEAQSEQQAKSRARAMCGKAAGAIAFSRRGDPSVGEFEPATILGRYGETPNDLD